MEVHQLRYFLAIAESGSFTSAARRCNVAQPSLSQQIRRFEDQLGLRLFDRLPKGAVLNYRAGSPAHITQRVKTFGPTPYYTE